MIQGFLALLGLAAVTAVDPN
jgi:lysosomal alpha-mannosidase